MIMPETTPNQEPEITVAVKQSWIPWLIVVALLAAAYIFGSCGKESAIEAWNKKFNNYRDSVQITLKQADSLNSAAQVKFDSAAILVARADSRKKQYDSLQALSVSLQHSNDSLLKTINLAELPLPVKSLITGLQSQIFTLQSQLDIAIKDDSDHVKALRNMTASNNLQTQRANNLQARLDKLPGAPPGDKLLGLIPLPSRQTSFFAGVAVTVVADLVYNAVRKK